MSSGNDLTTEAIRLALGMNQLRAEYASQNISRANTPGAQATRADFGATQALLRQAAAADGASETGLMSSLMTAPAPSLRSDPLGASIQLDEEVADMSSASLNYQALSESLGRHFGLMRLAVTGKN
ncbi:flagellar basal body rod protein FlgB [Arenimonas sp.]|uniref:flagellar basal body rod protein FlgB n=1 Tax=Arenimonas sp. TaxID=1872635 RepID=UPI0039E52B43